MKSKTYVEKLQDPRWQKMRLRVLERDNFTCCDCGATENTLHVHHCHYDKGNPWDTDESLIITVCKDCHEQRQELERIGKRSLAVIFARIANSSDDQMLFEFVKEISEYAQNKENCAPRIIDSFDDDWERDGRWFCEAEKNPRFREIYGRITGRNLKWEKIK